MQQVIKHLYRMENHRSSRRIRASDTAPQGRVPDSAPNHVALSCKLSSAADRVPCSDSPGDARFQCTSSAGWTMYSAPSTLLQTHQPSPMLITRSPDVLSGFSDSGSYGRHPRVDDRTMKRGPRWIRQYDSVSLFPTLTDSRT